MWTSHSAQCLQSWNTKWDISHFLLCLHTMLNDVPARREDFTNVTKDLKDSGLFPLQFCNHRWLENVKPAQRTIAMLPAVNKYLDAIHSGKVKSPDTKSFNVVREACKDKLLEAKLSAFVSVAKPLEQFLSVYHSDKVLLPFIAADQEKLVRNLLRRILKPDLLADANTMSKLAAFDVEDASNYCESTNIDLGFVANKIVRELLSKTGGISARQALEFRTEFRNLIVALVKNVLEKAPIKYKLVRCLSCLDPQVMCGQPELAVRRYRIVLDCLSKAGRIEDEEGDEIVNDFQQLVEDCQKITQFREFDMKQDRLGVLFYQHAQKYSHGWKILKKLLFMSHGQAPVERGFSVNKRVSVENLTEEHLIALRTVKDHIHSLGGLKSFEVTKELLHSCSFARQRYENDLKRKRDAVADVAKAKKRQAMMEEVDELKRKKSRIQAQVETLLKESDKYYDRAESTGNISFVANGNSLKKSARDKESNVNKITKELEEKQKLFKICNPS